MTRVHPNLRAWLDQLNPMIAEQKAHGVEATPQMVRDSLAGLTTTFVAEAPELQRSMRAFRKISTTSKAFNRTKRPALSKKHIRWDAKAIRESTNVPYI
ncbi:hypothetical protein [Stutzerimonas stutzeri]|uniref:hypothetical protein n=1 Tax=Stutzerimonas stutzeri TaxID=316 RepID=UPI00210E2874|nr:hypothetical protein [Stutzerimonas stutzeri]MCQ4320109.1 hypothetical protein [Stutzerimonas stutzeri]